MRGITEGYRVGVAGASSLLGKELLAQFEEQGFPVERLVIFEDEREEPELPIVDWQGGPRKAVAAESVHAADFDFVFLAAPTGGAEFLEKQPARPKPRCVVIDLSGRISPSAEIPVRIPKLEKEPRRTTMPVGATAISPHAAAIVLALLLERLEARYEIERANAHIFSPASEIGARAIEELQAQTIQLLSFQKIPEEVYGGRVAFNLLPRLTGKNSLAGSQLEQRIRRELEAYFGSEGPLPALRVVQSPVFYSLSVSLYVETREEVSPAGAAAALEGDPVKISKATDAPPSAVEAAGSGAIWVDRPAAEPGHPKGLWLWAVADSTRLAAINAIETAESLAKAIRS
jgi:aspartate-semialdehyde dehydrogenase